MKNENYKIKSANKNDVIEITQLLQKNNLPCEDVSKNIYSFLKVESQEGLLLGAAALEILGEVAFLKSVAVTPEVQRSGIGKILLEASSRRAKAYGIAHIYLLSLNSEDFFLKEGFKVKNRADAPYVIKKLDQFADCRCNEASLMYRKMR